ncbi:MAG: Probable lipoprotein Cj1090c [uncultured Sulfurovum sp.]|uniref:Probable lipoprotein Cj1090c n=1 Tax=uncultured Sulfurovum sp. TaxID=269237 RepID=A0A6S6STR8_9BACT|nr:MAG: Probable lipoprotein Cj1090c [uncultured Sulfurovum sp.]
MKKSYIFFLIFIFFTACGYKPSAYYAGKLIGEKVYTQVDVSLSDPENAVLTKDALNIALQTRLKRRVAKENNADSSIFVFYKNIRFVPLQYDRNGYVIFYQAHISLDFTFKKEKMLENRTIIGRFEFPIRASAIISNDLRLKAIEQGSLKALDEFITYLSVKGLLSNEQ